MFEFRKVSVSLISLALAIVVAAPLLTNTATAQVSGSLPAYVKAQVSSPGTVQSANINVSGTAIAGQFQGNGSGLTNVTASDLLLPFSKSIDLVGTAALAIENLSNGATPVGIKGTSHSPTGAGVYGANTSGFGSAIGVRGDSNSGNGFGVSGAGGTGVLGTSPFVGGTGVRAESSGTGSVALEAANLASSGSGIFVSGPNGGSISATAGNGIGLSCSSNSGIAMQAFVSTSEGTAGDFVSGSTLHTELAGPKGGVWTDGQYKKTFNGGTVANATPIAYGVISGTGTWDVVVNGETYGNSTHVVGVTPVSSSPLVFGVTNPGGGAFRVRIWTLSSVLTDSQFQFTVWTQNPTTPHGLPPGP